MALLRNVWVVMTVTILLTTLGSFSVWYVTAREDSQMTKTVVMDTMERVQGMNAAIKDLRAGLIGFSMVNMTPAPGEVKTVYRDSKNVTMVADYYANGVHVRSEYNARGNGTVDVTELFPSGAVTAYQIEYDVDDDGKTDAVMTDTNSDGILDNTEILLSVRGSMMPLSAVPSVFA